MPVHNDDRRLLGLSWEGQVYVDSALPFGLRSACKIFSAVADALQWAVIKDLKDGQGILYHYLDDFICIGPPKSEACSRILSKLVLTYDALGIPIATEKLEGPSTTLTFLGIELDTEAMRMCLPREKLERLVASIRGWLGRKACRKRELQSLAGLLQHASSVIRPGRCFLYRVYRTIALVAKPDHWIRLNTEFRSDLIWWHTFAQDWNGTSLLFGYHQTCPDATVRSDAAGNWGCGAWIDSRWLQVSWSGPLREDAIHTKEFIPIIFAAAIWGREWKGKVIQFASDNQAVVEVINRGYARDARLMQLVRCLIFIAASFEFWFTATHLPGERNRIADAISRNNMSYCHCLAPWLQPTPCFVPQVLIDLVLQSAPDVWTSQDWALRFKCSLSMH